MNTSVSKPFVAFLGIPMLSACAQQNSAPLPALAAQSAPPKTQTRALAQVASPKLSLQPSPAYRADDFIDSIGINGSPIVTNVHEDGPFKGAGIKFDAAIYHELGIRYYREVLQYALTREDQPQQVLDVWKKTGARAMLFLGHNNTKNPLDALPLLRKYDLRAVAEVEGPNEPNNKFPPQDLNHKYKGKTDEAATALYMQEFYDALKKDPQLKNLPVIGYSAIFTDYNLAKGHTGFDFGNVHSYQGYGTPSSSLEMNVTRWNNIYPEGAVIKPIVPTETGYNVEADKTNGTFHVGSYRAQALNLPMQMAQYFRHGFPRTYYFAIHNADGYGLLESDNVTKRPSFFAVKNFLSELREAKWNPKTLKWGGAKPFTPRSLNFTIENSAGAGVPETVQTLSLQKSSGETNLLIWNEVQNFDQNAKKDLYPKPVPVTIRFGAPVGRSATILTPTEKGAFTRKTAPIQNGVLRLEVPSAVTIVRLAPAPIPRIAPPTRVQNLSGQATHHEANLRWNAVPNAAGYFVWRNGMHVATVKQPQFLERTSWLRPGLGYTYEVAAYDRFGQTAPRTKAVVFTPNGRPDLVVTQVSSASNEVGKPAKFRATVKNIGDGPTPFGSVISATFFINGEFTAFSTQEKILNPGEEIALEANGGNANWAPKESGSYVITAQADDINRVSGERNESNNKTEWTLVAGQNAGGGQLEIASEAAPFSVNLEQIGARDWVAFGSKNPEGDAALKNFERKNGANLIGNFEKFGNGYLSSTLGSPVKLEWPGGSANSGLWWNGVGHGVRFSVPANTQAQTLRLYVSGLSGARGKLEATLSDNSAPKLVSTVFDGNRGNGNWAPIPDDFSGVYVVKFKAASQGQTLNVSWNMDNEPNPWNGQLRLQAIVLE